MKKIESQLEKLSQFVCAEDEAQLNEMLTALENVEDKTKNAGHINNVQMAEQFEFTFTVKDLLAQIS